MWDSTEVCSACTHTHNHRNHLGCVCWIGEESPTAGHSEACGADGGWSLLTSDS